MNSVTLLANEFLTAYNNGNQEEISHKAKILASAIRPNEWLFRNTENPYLMARTLYALLLESEQLSQPDYKSIIKIIYYCLLQNYLKYCDTSLRETNYGDYIGGCELGFIFLNQNDKFTIIREILCSLCFRPYAVHKYIIDQRLLFGGIVIQAKEKGYHLSLDASISRILNDMEQIGARHIPTGESLRNHEEDCNPTIELISDAISNSLITKK